MWWLDSRNADVQQQALKDFAKARGSPATRMRTRAPRRSCGAALRAGGGLLALAAAARATAHDLARSALGTAEEPGMAGPARDCRELLTSPAGR
ncbi:hypothetical protein AB0D38_01720 [Streptomyces sp. NPDC048279]|uniref:hypothetical protein n=1 Tax=Streptomyces sp. NPDC048279 TaxID=3154714 RepID=UPI00341ACCD0